MKLWIKSLLAVGIIGGATGVVIGGAYTFVKTNKSAQGYQYNSRLSKFTKIDKLWSGLEANVVKHGGDFFNDKIVSVDMKNHTINNKNIDDYFVEYANSHKGITPDFVIKIGSMSFNNEYTSAIKPSEFIQFIKWFFNNVSWGPEISTLTSFSIVRGVEQKGGSITLGGHQGLNHETTNIKFYPDAFFGSMPMFSKWVGPGQSADSMFAEFGKSGTLDDILNVLKNVVPIYDNFTQKITSDYVGKKIDDIMVTKDDVKDSKYRFVKHLYSTGSGVVNGKKVSKYQVFSQHNPELFKAIIQKYPYHLKEVTSPVIVTNAKGEYSVQTKKHKYVPLSERIPMSEVLSLNPKFKGYGTSWLHYVSAHEYGHHQTLNAVNDLYDKNVLLGGWTKQSGPLFDGSAYNENLVNMYLSARGDGIQVHGVSASESSKPIRHINNYQKGIYAKFSVDGGKTFETNKQIFGTDEEDRFKITIPSLTEEYWVEYYKVEIKFILKLYQLHYLKKIPDGLETFSFNSLQKLKAKKEYWDILQKLKPKLDSYIKVPKTYTKLSKDIGRGIASKSMHETMWKNKTFKGYLLNALDNNSGTLTEGFEGSAQVLFNGAFVNSNKIAKRTDLNPVEDEVYNSRVSSYSLGGFEGESSSGSTYLDMVKNSIGKSKFTIDDATSIFTDYTMTFPEILTRDFVQISYSPSKNPLMPGFHNFKDSSKNISEASTGFDYYISKNLNKKWIRYRTIYSGDVKKLYRKRAYSAVFWEQFNGKLSVNNLLKGTKLNDETKKSLERLTKSYVLSKTNIKHFLTSFGAFSSPKSIFLGRNLSMSNGYFKDRFIRKELNWSIYDDSGAQALYHGSMTDLNGKPIKGVADAYWYYLLKSKGIGNRTITGIWRSKTRDAIYAYGYVPKSLGLKIKYFAIKNKSTGEVSYIDININQDNLHYYKDQSTGQIKTLADEGYTSWTTNFFSSGRYSDAIAKPGNYSIYFTDQSKNIVDGLTLGSRNMITENGKLMGESATKIIKDSNGLTMNVLSQFVK